MNQQDAITPKRVSYVWVGLFLVAAGLLTAAYRLNAGIPAWLVGWPAALMAIGLLLAFYQRFRPGVWIVPLLWGAWWMAVTVFTSVDLGRYTTAIAFILTGILLIALRHKFSSTPKASYKKSDEGFLDSTSFASNAKREVTSQDFSGADVVCTMGHVEIDLSKADIKQPAHIDVTVFMGSAKILVPASWSIHDDVTTFFGDVKYRDAGAKVIAADDKVITFDGTAVLGAIEIVSC